MRTRVLIAVPGVLLGLYGIFRLVTQVDGADLLMLFVWLVAALIIHDGILSPVVVTFGTGIARVVPPRARRFLQGGLIAAALITVVAIPLIYREGTQPRIKALLRQNFTGNLGVLLLIVAVGSVLLYVASVLRRGASATAPPDATASVPDSAQNLRPDADQDSITE